MENQDYLYEKENGIAIITLNRPDKKNALTPSIFQGIFTSVDEAAQDDNIRVIIITGTGDAFCSGADVKAMAAGELHRETEKRPKDEKAGKHAPFAVQFRNCPKPIIAALNGVAVGVGLDLALSCDMRIASEKARATVGYVRRGMVPAAGSAWYLPRLLGLDKALKIILTSEMMDAQEMEKLGLVTMVVPDGELMDTAIDLAEQIVKAPMLAVQAAKQAVYESMNLDLAESLDLTMGIRQKLLTTNDYHESATAFVEKREPTFKGE